VGLVEAGRHAREERVTPDAGEAVMLGGLSARPLETPLILLLAAWEGLVETGLLLRWSGPSALIIDHLNLSGGTYVSHRCLVGERLLLLLIGVGRLSRVAIREDWLRVIDHVVGSFGLHLRLLLAHSVLDGSGDCNFKHLLNVLLRLHLLQLVELLLAQDRLAYVETVHIAAVAVVAEAEVQVVAVEAQPVANTLRKRLLATRASSLLSLAGLKGLLLSWLASALESHVCWALVEDLILILDVDLSQGSLDALNLALTVSRGV